MLPSYNFQTPYQKNIDWIKSQIETAKIGWQLSVVEGLIETHLYDKIVAQTGEPWLATSHCNDLQTLSLIKRCEILAHGNA